MKLGESILGGLVAVLILVSCAPGRQPAPVYNMGLRTESASGNGTVTISGDDTLWSISKRYRLPLRDIIDLNGLQPPYRLSSGARLKLPPPTDYTVRPHDNLNGVAGMFGVSVFELVRVNHLPAPYRLTVGQVLRMPSRQAGVAAHNKTSLNQAITAKPQTAITAKKDFKNVMNAWTSGAMTDQQPAKQDERYIPELRPFIWPVNGRILSSFGLKPDGLYNDGVNIAAPRGSAVKASTDGVVAFVGSTLESYGNLVLIRHDNDYMTAYAHLGSVGVRQGDIVKRGTVIGTIGSTGAVTGAQLHFEVRHQGKPLNPSKVI